MSRTASARPYGDDPNKCIFEAYALERFPEGEDPDTQWVHAGPALENWGPVLGQDFNNMEFIHKGMRSSGFCDCLPNPHRCLAQFMENRGAPQPLKG